MKTKPNILIIAAAILSFIFPGIGHFLLGFWKRGIFWAFGVILVGILVSYLFPSLTAAFASYSYFSLSYYGLTTGVLSALDAWRLGKIHNLAVAEAVEPEQLPKE